MEKKGMIAMSGGVDSSVAAWLMLRDGWDCIGVTMRLYHNETLSCSRFHTCCAEEDIEDAAEVAFDLHIPHEVAEFTREFEQAVMQKFIRVYEQGGTPNPCIDCNRYMKFERLWDYARERGCTCIASGHYARVEKNEKTGRFELKKGLDAAKDQSYVLYMLTQEQLAHTRFPLGGLHKEEVRRIAAEQGFVNARKHDSQDICFVPDRDYVRFMEQYTGKTYPEGDFIDEAGRVLGRHRGAVRYTLGQRSGLGLAMGHPVYVCGKDMAENTVTVGEREALYHDALTAGEMNWISIPALSSPMRVFAKTRYRQEEQPATAYPAPEGLLLEFDEPQRAVTAGQAVVLYDGDTVVGGGTILRAFDRKTAGGGEK